MNLASVGALANRDRDPMDDTEIPSRTTRARLRRRDRWRAALLRTHRRPSADSHRSVGAELSMDRTVLRPGVAPPGSNRPVTPSGPRPEPGAPQRRTAQPLATLGVLLDKLEDCNVLLGVTLHEIDQKTPNARVLHVTQLTLEALQLKGVLLLLFEECLG